MAMTAVSGGRFKSREDRRREMALTNAPESWLAIRELLRLWRAEGDAERVRVAEDDSRLG